MIISFGIVKDFGLVSNGYEVDLNEKLVILQVENSFKLEVLDTKISVNLKSTLNPLTNNANRLD